MTFSLTNANMELRIGPTDWEFYQILLNQFSLNSSTNTKNNYNNMVKNTVPILRFVYQIGVVAAQEGRYRRRSEDKNGSTRSGSKFKSRKL